MRDLKGIFSALLVSFNKDGSINKKGLRQARIGLHARPQGAVHVHRLVGVFAGVMRGFV